MIKSTTTTNISRQFEVPTKDLTKAVGGVVGVQVPETGVSGFSVSQAGENTRISWVETKIEESGNEPAHPNSLAKKGDLKKDPA